MWNSNLILFFSAGIIICLSTARRRALPFPLICNSLVTHSTRFPYIPGACLFCIGQHAFMPRTHHHQNWVKYVGSNNSSTFPSFFSKLLYYFVWILGSFPTLTHKILLEILQKIPSICLLFWHLQTLDLNIHVHEIALDYFTLYLSSKFYCSLQTNLTDLLLDLPLHSVPYNLLLQWKGLEKSSF